MIKKLIDTHLEFWNDYLTVSKFAEHKGLTLSETESLLKAAKLCFIRYGYDNTGVFLKPWGFHQIKEYVSAGGDVYWKNFSYSVICIDGNFYINHEKSTVGLYEPDYNPLDFFVV